MHPDPEFDRPASKLPLRPAGWWFKAGLVVACALVLIALLLPASRSARPPARRLQCASNLRQIALALQAYQITYGALTPAHTVDSGGRPLHSWRTLILPFLDSEEL